MPGPLVGRRRSVAAAGLAVVDLSPFARDDLARLTL